MGQTIFRKVKFTCGGCGKGHEAKAQVPVTEARTPLSAPAGWGTLDVTGQHETLGAITVLAIPVCSAECGERLAEGKGDAAVTAYMKACQMAFSGGNTVKADQPALTAVPDGGFDPPKAP